MSRVAGGAAMAGWGVTLGVPAVAAALALLCLFCALRAGRKRRLLDDLPTSKTTGVFMGLVELKGSAEAEQPLESYLAAARCVAYHWEVEERWSRQVSETTTDGAGKSRTTTRTESGWTSVAQGGEARPFYLKDDCGVILVRPEGANLEPQTVFDRTVGRGDPLYYEKGPVAAVPDSDHRRRFVERAVPLHAALLVLGQAREREDVVAAEIAADRNAPMFLISTRSEKQVSRGLRLGSWLLGALGVVVSVGGLVARDLLAHRPPGPDAPLFVVAGAAYLFLWLLGWAWMAYNSLIELRQRVGQGWANVEVQLERRHGLIPSLVAIVGGLRDYERRAQAELAALRVQLAATPPGAPGPDPARLPSRAARGRGGVSGAEGQRQLPPAAAAAGRDRAAHRAGPLLLQRRRHALQHQAPGRAGPFRRDDRTTAAAGADGCCRFRSGAGCREPRGVTGRGGRHPGEQPRTGRVVRAEIAMGRRSAGEAPEMTGRGMRFSRSRRIHMRRLPAGLLIVAAVVSPGVSLAQKAVIVARHAQNDGDSLTETGLAQAQRLATALENADVRAVYSTDSRRTIGTATPFAEARKLKVQLYDTAAGPGRFDARPFVAQLRKEHPGDVVLVVGHITTIPDLLKALGCPGDVTIAPLDYTGLFIVVPAKRGPSTLVRVKY